MNTCIETLNHWGENALAFAWPMLWQSSLLILVVAALDFLLARKIRPAIRHALWMIVLVKLLLSPTLALPTGAAWWLWPAKPALVPVMKNVAVTYNTDVPMVLPPAVPLTLPSLKLNDSGWIMLVSGVISAGLLCWLAFKWLSVGRNARKAGTAHELENLFAEARQRAGLRGPVRLRLIDDAQSPAVYGLFRPVILLPRALAERLSEKQLRAVLVHEAIHVRRGDVWVNCAQTLLQIFYWWHPLLWLANARIRRLREEAVDDAVMLALHNEADAYAPTLLEVAKFAFRRPLASLGLVGILESRSALRQRIERLVDFRPPRKAGVTLLSLCGIFMFSAVALPMGQAPVSTTDSLSANSQLPPAGAPPTRTAVLIDGRFFWMRSGDVETLTAGLPAGLGQTGQVRKWMADAEKWDEINQRIDSLNLKWFARPRIQTGSGIEADLRMGNATSGYEFDCTPIVADGRIDLTFKAKLRSDSLHNTDYFIVHENATVGDDGGVILRVPDRSDASSNLVLVIGIKTIEPSPVSEKNSAVIPGRNAKAVSVTNPANVLDPQPNSYVLDTEKQARDWALAGQISYEAGKIDEAKREFEKALAWDPAYKGAQYYLNLISQAKVAPPFDQVSIHDGGTHILDEISNLHLDTIGPFDKTSLDEVVRELNRKARQAGADFDIATLHPISSPPDEPTVTLPQLKNVSLTEAFYQIVLAASSPIKYMIMGDLVAFSPAEPGQDSSGVMGAVEPVSDPFLSHPPEQPVSVPAEADNLEMRTFKLNTNALLTNLDRLYKSQGHVSQILKEAFSEAGVDLSPPKTLFYNDGMGVLFVRATSQDLNVIERVIQNLDQPAQIHIKARFIEVPSTADVVANMLPLGKSEDSGAGILTASQMKALLHQLQSQNGTEELAEPEVTTLTRRQTEVRATGWQFIVTNFMVQLPPATDTPAVVPQIGNVELGTISDVYPLVLADGYTISLKALAERIQFFGYADPNGFKGFTTNYNGSEIQVPVTLPAVQASSASAQEALLYDGQTLVLFAKTEQLLDCPPDKKSRDRITQHIRQAEKKNGNKTLVALVTVTLIDPAGNRIHSDKDMPFAQDAIPPQLQISETVVP